MNKMDRRLDARLHELLCDMIENENIIVSLEFCTVMQEYFAKYKPHDFTRRNIGFYADMLGKWSIILQLTNERTGRNNGKQ